MDWADYWGCVECHDELIDHEAWDAVALAEEVESQIIEPGRHARELLLGHDVLTRLYTTISPHEMTEDPLFHRNPDLAEVTNLHIAIQGIHCDPSEADWLTLDDGRAIAQDDGQQEVLDALPAARRVERMPMAGAPQILADHDEDIAASLDAFNAQFEEGDGCSCRTTRVPWPGVVFMGAILIVAWPRRRRSRSQSRSHSRSHSRYQARH